MSRAKAIRCEHGSIHSAHIYKVGDPTSERDAIDFLPALRPGDTFEDIDVDKDRTNLFANCPCVSSAHQRLF